MANIRLEQVGKSFGKAIVIKSIDLDVEDGELIVILGPSGCGKSTLLRLVAGLERVTTGEVFIGGRKVNQLEPRQRDIAMVFQNYALYPHMTVRGNMAYGLQISKMPKHKIDERVNRAAEMLELEPYLDRLPRQLSGGQRQRVAMGRAIVREPSAFLFDEPLSNLDAKLRVQMRLEIRALQQKLGVTSLYVTHDQVEGMTLADRMLVMNDGNAEQIGTPMEIYRYPTTKFVAGFIGSPPMNFISAHAKDLRSMAKIAGADTLGIRPEDCSLVPKGQGLLDATVAATEALGAEGLVYGRLADGDQVAVRIGGREAVPEVDSVYGIDCDRERIHGFGPDGRRIGSD